MTEAVTQLEIDQRVFDLYDEYCHGRIDRREFLLRASIVVAGGLVMAQALLPRYAQAQTVSFTDARIKAQYDPENLFRMNYNVTPAPAEPAAP